MIRCERCIYPTTKPDLAFVDGICSACRAYERRLENDWPRLRLELASKTISQRGRGPWDLIVPASGGKDSHFQILMAKEMGLRPLAVVAGTDYLSDIGRRNIDNLKNLADVIEFVPNFEVRKKLVRIGLFEVGDMSWPEHCAIWSIPTRVAMGLHIPVLLYGEQPQLEYGGPEKPEAKFLTSEWVAEFGGMLGLRISDLVGREGLTEQDLGPYAFPEGAAVSALWLGHYIPWDGWLNGFIAQQYGFECRPAPVETSLADYENLDNYVTVLRDWLRFVKYGFSRATDIACNHIRRGRLSRQDALRLVGRAERFPRTSLGKPIEEVLGHFDLSRDVFVQECDKWTNRQIFKFEGNRPSKSADGTPERLPSA